MYYKLTRVFATLLMICALAACGGASGDSSSGSSSVPAPLSITGYTLSENLDPAQKTVHPAPGSTGIQFATNIVYQFVNSSTILGIGLIQIPTQSWSYTASGNVAYVHLQMSTGVTDDILTFTTPTSGTFTTSGSLISGTTFTYGGTFSIQSSGTSGSAGTGSTGTTSTTGQVAFWTSRTTGNITVSVDGASVGTLTQYYTSMPTCGSSGTITKTLSAGSHTMTASSSGVSWGPSTFTISAGGCLIYQLN